MVARNIARIDEQTIDQNFDRSVLPLVDNAPSPRSLAQRVFGGVLLVEYTLPGGGGAGVLPRTDREGGCEEADYSPRSQARERFPDGGQRCQGKRLTIVDAAASRLLVWFASLRFVCGSSLIGVGSPEVRVRACLRWQWM